MRRFPAALLGLFLVLTTVAAGLPPVSQAAGNVTMRQRILMRRSVRMGLTVPRSSVSRSSSATNGVGSSSRSAAAWWYTRPARSSLSSYIYSGTPIRGVLQIDQVSTGATDNAAGTQFVTLITFDAIAGHEDLTLSTFKFRAEEGSLSSADQYAIYEVAPSGVMKQIATAAPGGGALTFSNLGYILRHGITQRFAVRARLNSAGVSSTLALGFLTSDPLFVQATGMRYGRDLAPGIQVDDQPCDGQYVCRIAVHTRASRTVAVESMGNLYVTADTTPVASRQLLLGSVTDTIMRLSFRATHEDVAVTSLAISGLSDSIEKIELFLDGASVPFASATQLQCDTVSGTRFCAELSSGLFTVPQDRDVRVSARAVMKPADDGGTSGEEPTPTLSDSIVLTAVTAEGVSSQRQLSQNDGDGGIEGEIFIGRSTPGANVAITGSTHDTVAAKFAAISNSSNDPDLTPVPFGRSVIGSFRFTAQPNGNNRSIILRTLVFTMTAINVNVDPSGIVLFNTANPADDTTCSASGTTGTVTVTCSSLENANVSTIVANNGSLTVGLRATVSQGTSGGTGYLQAILGELGDRANPGTIEWSDDDSVFDWVDLGVTQVKSTLYRS